MIIHQFEDKGLAHYSYAVLCEQSAGVILIDPARNPQPYYNFAAEHHARIVGVIETHPHADFVSAHLEIQDKTGAQIYVSKLLGAEYPHQPFDDGDAISMGELRLRALNTPGHSPDSISVVLEQHGKEVAVFTGDTLFIGDVGRPDLRENTGNITAKREELARQMYKSTREKLMPLADHVVVYPAHGAGSLCGKALGNANSSTIGVEKQSNYALQPMSEEAFIHYLLEDQPFIPKYFAYDVALNKKGAPAYHASVKQVALLPKGSRLAPGVLLIDGRPQHLFKTSHLKGAINIQDGGKFETWLGSIVGPDEKFYLLAASEQALEILIAKAAKIGYELNIAGAMVYEEEGGQVSDVFEQEAFLANPEAYTLIDIRNSGETKAGAFFEGALRIPLPELRERLNEIPATKPVVVHCAGGYRSAAGSSIIANALQVPVMDMGEAVTVLKHKALHDE